MTRASFRYQRTDKFRVNHPPLRVMAPPYTPGVLKVAPPAVRDPAYVWLQKEEFRIR